MNQAVPILAIFPLRRQIIIEDTFSKNKLLLYEYTVGGDKTFISKADEYDQHSPPNQFLLSLRSINNLQPYRMNLTGLCISR